MTLVRIPLAPRSKVPLVPDWQNLAPDDPVWEAVARNVPDCNWGLRLDDFVVADCDSLRAVDFWAHNCPVVSPVRSTGNPERMAFWYRRPASSELRTCRLDADLEIRTGSGAQQVIPPSIHPSGHSYQWLLYGIEDFDVPDLAQLPEAPEGWILAQKPSAALWGDGEDGWDVIPEGGRNTALTAIGGLLRRHGASKAAIERALRFMNAGFCSPELTPEELDKVAWSVSRYAPAGDVEVTWEEQDDDEVVSLEEMAEGYTSPWLNMRTPPD